jgi:hypothetical protein
MVAQLKDMLKEKGLKVATVSGASDGDIIAYPLGKHRKRCGKLGFQMNII